MAMEEKQPSGDFEAYESVTSIINPRRSTFEELAGLTQENIFNPGYRVTICIRKGQDSIDSVLRMPEKLYPQKDKLT